MKRPSKLVLFLFFVISLFLYFYRYPKMLGFDADQEFYARQYLEVIRDHKFTSLGIETSIGGMFVGPLYTYLNVLMYWLFGGDPMGIFLFTLIFSSLGASFTYYLFTKLKGKRVGLISGFLVLISAALWNKAFIASPVNFLYPMGLFFFYILVKLRKNLPAKAGKKYFFWLGVLLALTIQIHFSLFFLFPITIIFLIWQRLITKENVGNLFKAVSIILVSLSPLIFFDFRHNFFITNNLWRFIARNTVLQESNAGFFSMSAISSIFVGLIELFSHTLTPKPTFLIYIFLAGVAIYFVTKVKKGFPYKVISLIYIVSIFLFLLYQGSKPDYFFYFLLAPFFLVLSEFILLLFRIRILNYPIFIFLLILTFQNLRFMNSSLNHYNFFLKKQVAKYIKDQSQGRKVKISYDTDLGLGFGFDYLLKYEGVDVDNENFEENYHIVIKNYENYPGREFKESDSPVSIKVVKLEKDT